jgi:hypothetical protein
VGTEEVDGRTLLHVQLETDFATAMAALADSFETTGLDANSLPTAGLGGPLVLDLWVDPSTGLPARLSATGSMDCRMTAPALRPASDGVRDGLRIQKYNTDVDIPTRPRTPSLSSSSSATARASSATTRASSA